MKKTYDKKIIMNRAWAIAKEAKAQFGGKACEYLSEAMKLAWNEVKKSCEITFNTAKGSIIKMTLNGIDLDVVINDHKITGGVILKGETLEATQVQKINGKNYKISIPGIPADAKNMFNEYVKAIKADLAKEEQAEIEYRNHKNRVEKMMVEGRC